MPTGRGPLRIAIEDFLQTFGIGDRIAEWLKKLVDNFAAGASSQGNHILQASGSSKTLPDWLTVTAQANTLGESFAHLILSVAGFIVASVQSFSVAARPFVLLLQRQVAIQNKIERPGLSDLQAMKRRRPDLAGTIERYLAELGFNDQMMSGLDTLDHSLLGARDYFDGFARGSLDAGQVIAKLQESGLALAEIELLFNLFPNLPSVGQAVEIAQRLGGGGGGVNRFGLDEGITSEYLETMKKLHYDDDTARKLWKITRQLPNIGQLFEMEQRLRPGRTDAPVTQSDVSDVLAALGVPAFWVDRLTQINRPVYPRLIIRGMYAAGTLSADEVLEAVKDLGYAGDRAQKVADYLTREVKSTNQGLTRDAIISSYKSGLIGGGQLIDSLVAIGLSQDDAEFYKSLADYDVHAQAVGTELSVIQQKYLNGTLDELGLSTALGGLNLPSERVTALQELWNIQRQNKTNVPSRAELDDLLRRTIIDHTTYQAQLQLDGYSPEGVDWFTRRVDQIIADDSAAAAASAQTEQERLDKAAKATVYQKDRADLDVQIAQVRAAIADIQLALHDVTDPDQQKALGSQVAIYRNYIVTLQLQMAQLKLDFISPPASPVA